MMKKFTALLVGLLMLFTLASAQSVDFSGVWYLVSVESQGIAVNPADMGMEMVVTLNADGTGLVVVTGEEDTVATWSSDGATLSVTAENEALTLALTAEGLLVAQSEDNKMTFGREPAAPSFIPAAEVAAEDIAAFNGTWTITMVNAYGMVVPYAAMASMGMVDETVVIQDGSVTSFGATEPEVGTLVDGKLVITSPNGESFGKSISMLEDGTMALTYMEIVFYCVKVEVVE